MNVTESIFTGENVLFNEAKHTKSSNRKDSNTVSRYHKQNNNKKKLKTRQMTKILFFIF